MLKGNSKNLSITHNTRLNQGIDTQSSMNAIFKETFEKMIIKRDLLKDDPVVYSFDGKQPLKSIGK